jgi:hypothetical protein
MLVSSKTSLKGSAFALSTGTVISNEHVVRGSAPGDLVAVASDGRRLAVRNLTTDTNRDLAAIVLTEHPATGLRIQQNPPSIGDMVHTWGYPLAYNGPSPLLSVGYLAGFNPARVAPTAPIVKHYVVNGAFNPGNSGGPLIAGVEDAAVGVVVSKHAPISAWHLSAIEALKAQQSGFVYTATDAAGKQVNFSEGQLVGELLQYFRDMTQVVIGEAIAADELVHFLDERGIAWTPA